MAGSAGAVIQTATFSGVMTQGQDLTGEWLAAGTSLTGKAASVTFTFETDNSMSDGCAECVAYVTGGDLFDTPNPITSVLLDIEGHTLDLTHSYYGMFTEIAESGVAPGNPSLGAFSVQNRSTGNAYGGFYRRIDLSASTATPILVASLTTPLAIQAAPFAQASFQMSDTVAGQPLVSGYSQMVYGSFAITDIVIGNPVPEPATWALLIGGFGLAGTALRRRRIPALC